MGSEATDPSPRRVWGVCDRQQVKAGPLSLIVNCVLGLVAFGGNSGCTNRPLSGPGFYTMWSFLAPLAKE